MTIIDLDLNPPKNIEYDVLIIGAGTIGLFVAKLLAEKSINVCVVERGSEELTLPNPNDVLMLSSNYSGAEMGRIYGLGGTSNVWGGVLIPFQKREFENKLNYLDYEEMKKYLEEVETFFHLDNSSYDSTDFSSTIEDSPFLLRKAKWPKFKNRNTWTLVKRVATELPNLDVYTNASFTTFESTNTSIERVYIKNRNSAEYSIRAKKYILSAGALESTKILLELKNKGVGISEKLGSGLSDHLSFLVGTLEPKNKKGMNKWFGYRFTPGGGMENLRFEGKYPLLMSDEIPFFFHFSFQSDSDSFKALRNILQSLQKRRFPSIKVLMKLLLDARWFMRAIFWRFIHHRVLFPNDAKIELHCVLEKKCDTNNFVRLLPQDQNGREQLGISWHVPQHYATVVESLQNSFLAFWNYSSFRDLGTIVPSDMSTLDVENFHGIFHPTGTTRIGDDQDNAVVDCNLKVFGLDNLYTVSTAVLPNSGAVNPTLEALRLGARLAKKLGDKIHLNE